MTLTQSSRRFLPSLAVFLMTSGLLLSLMMPFFCFPPLSHGHWFQVEMPLVILYTSASLCLIGATCLFPSHPLLFKHAAQHPLVLLFFLIATISACCTPLRPIPMLSLFGSAELGQGIFWFLSISALLMSMLLIKITKTPRLIVITTSLAVTSVVTFLTLCGKHFNLPQPYDFEDFLAFYALFLLPILLLGFHSLDKGKFFWLSITFCACILILSDNKAAILLTAGLSLLIPLMRRCLHATWYRRSLFALTLLLPLCITGSIYYAGKGYESDYDTSKGRLFLTLKSRAQLTYIPLKLLSLNTWPVWLTGVGWGMNDDEMIRQIRPDWIYMGAEDVKFEFFTARQPLHWHNEYIQALFSGGILCGLLMLLLSPLLLLTAQARARGIMPLIVLIYCALSAVWFQMPITIPLMAMAFALIADIKKSYWQLPSFMLLISCLLSVFALFYAIQESFWVAYHFDAINPPPSFSSAKETPETCGDQYVHFNRGGQSILRTYDGYYNEVIALNPTRLIDAGPAEIRDWLDCVLQRQLATKHSQLHVYTNLLSLYSRLSKPDMLPIARDIPNFDKNFETSFETIWKIAPNRTDLAIALFQYWLTTEQKQKAIDLADRLYKKNHTDPIALWYTGTFLIAEYHEYSKGMRRLNLALDNHIQQILSLDQTTVDKIRSTAY